MPHREIALTPEWLGVWGPISQLTASQSYERIGRNASPQCTLRLTDDEAGSLIATGHLAVKLLIRTDLNSCQLMLKSACSG